MGTAGQDQSSGYRQSKDGTYFIIGKVAEDKVLIQDPLKGNHPEILNKEEFMERQALDDDLP